MIVSKQDVKARLAQRYVRIQDLRQTAAAVNISLGKARTKAAIISILTTEESLSLLQAKSDALPEFKPDPEVIRAEAERQKVETDAKTIRLQALRDALDTSTKVNRTLGFSFVALMFYILLIVASTTDLQLFLPESKIRLPIVEVELPLLGFYSVVPFLILVFHFHLLINLKHHQDKYRQWRSEAGDLAKDTGLDPILLNFLDSYDRWYHPLRILLLLVISASVFYFPLVNLVLMQWRFGAYHHFEISTGQWIATIIDTILVAFFFDHILRRSSKELHRIAFRFIYQRIPIVMISGAGVTTWLLALKLLLLLENPKAMEFLPPSWTPLIDLTNSVDRVGKVEDGYVLHYLRDTIDGEEARLKALAAFGTPLDLAGRDFRFAILDGVNLSRADMKLCRLEFTSMNASNFSGADLSGAKFTGAHIKKGIFTGANLFNSDFGGADLSEAKLTVETISKANFKGANLFMAKIGGADFRELNLEGAILSGLNLDEMDLSSANLKEADLKGAILNGCMLIGADLEGADLHGASLIGADLRRSHLEGANLLGVHLEGANLAGAYLEGADLLGAHLECANLRGSHLDGVDLFGGHLEGADLNGADLAAANLRAANLACAIVNQPDLDSTVLSMVDWVTPANWEELLLLGGVLSDSAKRTAFNMRLEFGRSQCASELKLEIVQNTFRDEMRKRPLALLACRDKYIAKGVLSQLPEFGRRFQDDAMILQRDIATIMCTECIETFKRVNEKWPTLIERAQCTQEK